MKGLLSKVTMSALAFVLAFGSVLLFNYQSVEANQGGIGSVVYDQFEGVVEYPTVVKALLHANPDDYLPAEVEAFLDPQPGQLYVAFDTVVIIEDYNVEDTWDILSELTNDSVWYAGNSETTLVYEGVGDKSIGRIWEQSSDFGGIPTQDIVTRVFADVNDYQVYYGSGTLTEYLTLNTFEQLPNGDVEFHYSAILRPNLPVPQEGLAQFLSLVPVAYNDGLLPYLGKSGISYLTQMQFHTF